MPHHESGSGSKGSPACSAPSSTDRTMPIHHSQEDKRRTLRLYSGGGSLFVLGISEPARDPTFSSGHHTPNLNLICLQCRAPPAYHVYYVTCLEEEQRGEGRSAAHLLTIFLCARSMYRSTTPTIFKKLQDNTHGNPTDHVSHAAKTSDRPPGRHHPCSWRNRLPRWNDDPATVGERRRWMPIASKNDKRPEQSRKRYPAPCPCSTKLITDT